ncbi:MAG: Serine acetyltransferase [Myxococcaceae bacterium]|nr:Serine acetyltransferase [Myxococcaceae bacterium]
MDPNDERFGPGLWVSVVIATYNRHELLRRLLEQLDDQTIGTSHYEVIAVDDGSKEDTRAKLAGLKTKYALRIERQENAGAATARQRGVDLATGKVIVIVDDDMQVKRDFLEKHLAKHATDRTVVLGRLRPDAKLSDMPLFERFYARVLAGKAEAFAAGKTHVRGHDVYTGNVSFPRKLFLEAGGFDAQFRALEDEELGIRLEKAGATFAFANEAESVHGSDWTSMKAWMNRAHRDGVYSSKVSRKHPDHPESSPWRHLPNLNPVSRPFMALSLAAPAATSLIASAAIRTAAAFDKVGLEPVAIAGATFVYGIQYYRGVRQETGGVGDVMREYREFKRGVALLRSGEHGDASAWKTLTEGVREDHRMIRFYAEKYDGREGEGEGAGESGTGTATATATRRASIAGDAVKKIGFQLMIAYRVMRFFRQAGLGLGAQFMSRSIRHAFASDIHWDAELEPGIVIVHGFGLAVSYAAKVRAGCILFQNVTLGYGNDPVTKQPGAPLLERNVHVGIGATLYGPIVVGEGTKIMAGCVLSKSVPARSIVEAPVPQVGSRAPQASPGGPARPPLR